MTIAMLTLGATATVGADSGEEGLVVALDSDGVMHVEEIQQSELDHFTNCTWDIVESFCTTGSHGPADLLLHGFFLPTGTTIGDFQSNMVGDAGSTAQFQCTFTFLEGAPIPGTGNQAPGLDCRASSGSLFPVNEAYTHDCYAFPAGVLGTVVAEDPATQGPGLPGWVNQPEDSTVCINDDFSFFL